MFRCTEGAGDIDVDGVLVYTGKSPYVYGIGRSPTDLTDTELSPFQHRYSPFAHRFSPSWDHFDPVLKWSHDGLKRCADGLKRC